MANSTRDQSLALARRIRAAGIPIPIAEDDEKDRPHQASGLLIRQVGGVIESSVADSDGGLTLYALHVRITIDLPGPFAVSGFMLEPPWEDRVIWLDDPVETEARWNVYRFPGTSLEYDRSQVINHCADVRRMFSRGQSVQGFLLGVGFEPIPDRTWPGNLIPATLTVFDQFDREYPAPVFLWADRSERFFRRARKKVPTRSLYDFRDPLPVNGRPVKK